MADIKRFYEYLQTTPNVPDYILDVCSKVDGMCPPESLAMLNYAVSNCLRDDEQYLEIGTWKGRTAICALQNNDKRALVIDPLTFDNSREICPRNFATYKLEDRLQLIIEQWEHVLPLKKHMNIGVHFFDGDHGALATFHAFEMWLPQCANECILIADDVCMNSVHDDMILFRDKYAKNIVFEHRFNYGMGQYIFGFKK